MYLSGAINQMLLANPRADLGLMIQPGMGNTALPLAFWSWAADNGCYSQGDNFVAGDWLEWLAGLRRYRPRCLFAVAPDVVGNATATLERSLPYLPTIRQLGFPAAFVIQDGCRSDLVPWSACDALFIGGSTEYKLSESAFALVAEAKARGLHAHMGRVNSLRRLRVAHARNLDTVDGTFLKFGPERNLPQLWDWLDQVNSQTNLEISA